ncbi:hypothetical protein [Neisseria meningitidis]|nr:hypothetical protein [Neisseria meningitidis]
MLCPNTARNKENIMSIKSDKWIRRMSEEFGMIKEVKLPKNK